MVGGGRGGVRMEGRWLWWRVGKKGKRWFVVMGIANGLDNYQIAHDFFCNEGG